MLPAIFLFLKGLIMLKPPKQSWKSNQNKSQSMGIYQLLPSDLLIAQMEVTKNPWKGHFQQQEYLLGQYCIILYIYNTYI